MASAILYATVIWPLATCDSLHFDHLAEPIHLLKRIFLHSGTLRLQLNHMLLKLCHILNKTLVTSCSL